MYRHTKGGRHYLVKGVVEYYAAVAHACRFQGACMGLEQALVIEVLLSPPDKRVRDMDNAWKVIGDALTKANVWRDDSQIRSKHIIWAEPAKPGRVVVYIRVFT